MSRIRIHPIQTGVLQVRPSQVRAAAAGWRGALAVLRDREWTRELPIFCYLIEHPEGLFLVDTGESARVMDPGYLCRWNPALTRALRFRVTAEDEVGPQLQRLGVAPADVGTVLLTHLHSDHSGGLRYFDRARIFVSAREWRDAQGALARFAGYPNRHWPDWFAPLHRDMDAGRFGSLRCSAPLTGDGAIFLLATPGHTAGHQSVVVQDGGVTYLIAGDASYLRATMAEAAPDASASEPAQQIATLRAIRQLALQNDLVYLPAHDPDAPRRLRDLDTALD